MVRDLENPMHQGLYTKENWNTKCFNKSGLTVKGSYQIHWYVIGMISFCWYYAFTVHVPRHTVHVPTNHNFWYYNLPSFEFVSLGSIPLYPQVNIVYQNRMFGMEPFFFGIILIRTCLMFIPKYVHNLFIYPVKIEIILNSQNCETGRN